MLKPCQGSIWLVYNHLAHLQNNRCNQSSLTSDNTCNKDNPSPASQYNYRDYVITLVTFDKPWGDVHIDTTYYIVRKLTYVTSYQLCDLVTALSITLSFFNYSIIL